MFIERPNSVPKEFRNSYNKNLSFCHLQQTHKQKKERAIKHIHSIYISLNSFLLFFT